MDITGQTICDDDDDDDDDATIIIQIVSHGDILYNK